MILIISSETDSSTNRVIKWLRYYNSPFLRLNERDEILLLKVNGNDLVFSIRGTTVKLSKINSVWYRRGNLNIDVPTSGSTNDHLSVYKESEKKEILEYAHNLLRKKKSINNYNYRSVNKLDVLKYCQNEGLNNVNFLVTQSKNELLNFYKNEKVIISKALKSTFSLVTKEGRQSSLTTEITEEDIKRIPETFTPTFFQKMIKKKYEIRTYYLDGSFYSMAIFSQKNNRTQVDYRNYDSSLPNRTIPYQLPTYYQEKVHRMLKHFQINSASIDTIVSPDKEYFMIDINPIGQFGMTSIPCNYNLEKIIAEYLIGDEK